MSYTGANMRILFTRFPLESALGGAEIQTLSLMKGLRQHSHAIAFLGSCPTLLAMSAEADILNAHLEIGPPPVTKFHAMSFFWRKQSMKRKLETALNEFGDINAIFMLSLSEKLLMTEAAFAKGIKVFWIEHDRVGPWLTKNPWLPQLRKLSEKVTTICVSELSRTMYLHLGWKPENVIAIPNGIVLTRFSRADGPKLTIHDSRLHLGCVARLSQEKGIDLLIQAVSSLSDVSLTIIGAGPQESSLRSLIEKTIQPSNHPTISRVQMLPHVNDLCTFYRSIDALVLPSRENDPFGLVVAEAMSVGTPVIVTDQCGIAGYLHNGHDAVIVKAESADALKTGIVKLMNASVRKALGEHATETARKLFSLDRMIDAYEELLKQ